MENLSKRETLLAYVLMALGSALWLYYFPVALLILFFTMWVWLLTDAMFALWVAALLLAWTWL